MFDIGRAEVQRRILASRRFLAMADSVRTASPREVATCRGLLFVQLYGIYEFSIKTSVQAVLSFIRRDALAPRNIRHNALTLALNSSFESLAKVGPWKTWEKRLSLVSDLESQMPLHTLVDTAFPSDGSQYRAHQLQTIWDIFGLSCPILPDNKHIGRVAELVENRNAVAHGRRTAEDVGSGFSLDDMKQRIDDIETISIYLLTEMENHYNRGGIRR